MSSSHDARVRAAAFAWLSEQVSHHGDVLPRSSLAAGFSFEGVRVPLLGPQGIFKPQAIADAPLSITTAPSGPYDDSFGPDDLLRYRYRGTNPDHIDNKGLRHAMANRIPLIYFHGVVPGQYIAAWPVFIVADDPTNLTFTVAVDDAKHIDALQFAGKGTRIEQEQVDLARRSYMTAAVRVRLHQRAFRERVLEAYRRRCAFCNFRHEEMLDAAHIVPDSHPKGEPLVRNGMALCTLHHSAFDRLFLGVRPDYVIEVRSDLLTERDGPTLVGIQSLHGKKIILPRSSIHRPDPELLALRYEQFRHTE